MTQKLCAIGRYCPKHNYIHGAEAEEFRCRMEEAIKEAEERDDEACIGVIQKILDDVDARDSLAYLESVTSPKPG